MPINSDGTLRLPRPEPVAISNVYRQQYCARCEHSKMLHVGGKCDGWLGACLCLEFELRDEERVAYDDSEMEDVAVCPSNVMWQDEIDYLRKVYKETADDK